MNKKLYELGLVLGRFGHEHLDHENLINTSITLCEKTLILVGSAQEFGTLRNPFDIDTRISIIKDIHPLTEDTLIIRGINDLKNEFNNDVSWGKFVKSEVERHMGKFADLIIYGNDPIKRTWFDQNDILNTSELFVPRGYDSLSATYVRGLLTIGDKDNWKKATSPRIHNRYEELREKLLAVPAYQQIYNELHKDFSFSNYIYVYDKYVQIDKHHKLEALSK